MERDEAGARWGCSGRHRTEKKREVWSRWSRKEIERDKGRSGLGCLVSIRVRERGGECREGVVVGGFKDLVTPWG